jgi:hypothetical protein
MKHISFTVTLVGMIFGTLLVRAQSFQNLSFEDANPVIDSSSPNYPYAVTTASALPYWAATIGGVQQADVIYNNPSTGVPQITLISMPVVFVPNGPIDGSYSVFLQGTSTYTVSISQTGLIPTGTQSLFLDVGTGYFGALNVLVGTQSVPLSIVGSGPNNSTMYGGNLSAWPEQPEPLTISVASGHYEIDDISFSQTAITPEPSPLILTGIGGLIFALHRRFRRR